MNLIFHEELLVYTQTDACQNQSNNRLIVFLQIKKKRIQKKNETYEIHVSTTILFMIGKSTICTVGISIHTVDTSKFVGLNFRGFCSTCTKTPRPITKHSI